MNRILILISLIYFHTYKINPLRKWGDSLSSFFGVEDKVETLNASLLLLNSPKRFHPWFYISKIYLICKIEIIQF